ncbi:MAG: multidrug efflux pump subunit AcrA (membrane-fusion protein) [Planctomycetota bacterium]|jgi:multidrug efflux pump subunit AcrA (membrane-fusion protein)
MLSLGLFACGGDAPTKAGKVSTAAPAAVEVGPITRGPISLRRSFSGTLEASGEVNLASRISGHLDRLTVDLGDVVERGQVIAWLDSDELELAELQAIADLAVAKANLQEAEAGGRFARRTLERREVLGAKGITSPSELDSLRASATAADAAVAVTQARVRRAEAALEGARLRLAQTQVIADWEELSSSAGDGLPSSPSVRFVSARFMDEGRLVSAGTPLVSVVALRPIVAVVTVPERDYARLAAGLQATITTDAYPAEEFQGVLTRIAPVFSRATRQVRVEIELANEDLRLKPGMFVRAELELARASNATIVPFVAVTERSGVEGVFVLNPGANTVRWAPIQPGIRDGASIQILNNNIAGQVVTLGQEMCDDGSTVIVPEPQNVHKSNR